MTHPLAPFTLCSLLLSLLLFLISLLSISSVLHAAHPLALSSLLYVARLGTIALASIVCTISPCWFVVTLRNLMIPWFGLERDDLRSRISVSTVSTSPGRTALGQRNSSTPKPMAPSAKFSVCTKSRIVIAAVCHPLAINPLKSVRSAAFWFR